MPRDPEIPPGFEMRTLRCSEAEAGLRLSRLAGWNQTEGDWEFLLAHGRGWGFFVPDVGLVASAVAMDLSRQSTWISMVLTDRAWQRRGFASILMQEAMSWGQERGRRLFLDATPEGEQVYRQLGFQGDVALARWRILDGAALDVSGEQTMHVRPMEAEDIARVATWDADRCGWERRVLLAYLFREGPDLAFVSETGGSPNGESKSLGGFLMGREGDNATHFGPIVAAEAGTAIALMRCALRQVRGPCLVDAFEANEAFLEFLSQSGFQRERGFRRMGLGARQISLHSSPPQCFASGGPEMA